MKFINVISKHTREEMDSIKSNLDDNLLNSLARLYESFEYVEYTTKDRQIAMYAVIHETDIDKLFSAYIECSIMFSHEDLTKPVLFGNLPEITDEKDEFKIEVFKNFVNEFIENNLDTDVVLEKISKSGMKSLSEIDKKVLEYS